ncbi:MAG TPA: ABC transporter permease [Synechococcales cyanobacterium M55_K2018_004]|nr:ABC transporter permease [Synechococcales cyanobacterium M55_K2018_004]
MALYLVKRLLIAIPTIVAISLVIFVIVALAPGDPMAEFALNPSLTEEVRENIRRSLGLDQPLPIRYVKWVWAFFRGDMGYSFTSRSPVKELIAQRLPTTLWVVGMAYALSLLLAVPLGVWSAVRRNTWGDRLLTTLALVGYSLPPFVLGLVLIIVFSVQLGWLPFIYDSTLQVQDWPSLVAQLQQSTLPILTLVLLQAAMLMRLTRSAMLEEMPQNYVRTAHAKGLSHLRVILHHILRNALLPIVTMIALDVPSLFTGALVTEQIFRVPGIGALLIDSIFRNDTPVVLAITLMYGILVVVFNVVADLLYQVLDPRIQLG